MHGKSWRWLYLSRICYWESPYLTASCSPCTFMLFLKKNVNMALISHWKEKRESWASIAWGIWTKKYFLLRIPAEVRLGPSMLVSLGVESLLEHRAGGDPVHQLGWFFSCGCLFPSFSFPSFPFSTIPFLSFALSFFFPPLSTFYQLQQLVQGCLMATAEAMVILIWKTSGWVVHVIYVLFLILRTEMSGSSGDRNCGNY